jgi:hypothetical protein
MLVDGDRISWIGSASELSAVPSDSYQFVDLDGATVMPGFIDSHVHLCYWARSRRLLDLSRTKSIGEVQRLVRDAAAARSRSDKSWIVGVGWKRERWRNKRRPHKSDLDRVVADRPVTLASKEEHLLWVNSKALQVAGIDRATADPDGGVIERDRQGEATGILKEEAAWLLRRLETPPRKRLMLSSVR